MTSAPLALSRALYARGYSIGQQAEILGLPLSLWWKYRAGRSPQCSRLSEWLATLATEGIRLHATEVEGTGWVVTEVSADPASTSEHQEKS